jgi:hypothetical protein
MSGPAKEEHDHFWIWLCILMHCFGDCRDKEELARRIKACEQPQTHEAKP